MFKEPDQKEIKDDIREKRRENRLDIGSLPVEIFDEDGLTILGVGDISNLGLNCAGLYSTINLAQNKYFYMRFLLERKFLVNVLATVTRVVIKERKKYYGVRFNKVDLLQKDLKQFLENKLLENSK